ncbi:two-component system, sensor histidine kinase YesM [Paenibacillus polysaccharolyticus]|uniref:histidine kinase n=1 Tax=Paenibacillus polysaccharolyticus TaxID=582692 RepID=A0A1G5K351_9BACL|nr:sensor histidine kinase [Paenibacillus polysaccharolyticus]SCY94884.1 two-component system, sensor histidine kinase YesM [Paenibacillus polysaccharolyticus]
MFNEFYRRLIDPFKRSIRNKLILTMTLVAVLPVIVITAVAAENARSSMEAEVMDTNRVNMNWASVYLAEQFTRMNNIIYSIQISDELHQYLALGQEAPASSRFDEQKAVFNMLNSVYYSAGNYVFGVELYLKEQDTLFTFNSMESRIKTVADIPQGYHKLFTEHKDFTIINDPVDPQKFHMTRSMNRFEDQAQIGAIGLEIKWAEFNQTLELLDSRGDYTAYIGDSSGHPVYQPNSSIQPSDEALKKLSETKNNAGFIRTAQEYIFYHDIESTGLRVIKIVPDHVINESALETMKYGLVVGGVATVVSVALAALVAWRTSKPIVRLANSMKGIQLIKDRKVERSGRVDEIGLLEKNLHGMASRIREHIRDNYLMNLEKQTAELKALQSQIHPHFLQNTLQMIGGMVYSQKPADSYKVIRALSEMFRYIVRAPDGLVPLQSELDQLEHYMLIQKQRFATRLEYKLEITGELRECYIPKLSLQPIVENAFLHGLEKKPGEWKLGIEVLCDPQQGRVTIQICDNGMGMEPDRLVEMQSKLERITRYTDRVWNSGTSIGLLNAASRMVMHFGPDYGMRMESKLGQGTKVIVTIPCTTGGEPL